MVDINNYGAKDITSGKFLKDLRSDGYQHYTVNGSDYGLGDSKFNLHKIDDRIKFAEQLGYLKDSTSILDARKGLLENTYLSRMDKNSKRVNSVKQNLVGITKSILDEKKHSQYLNAHNINDLSPEDFEKKVALTLDSYTDNNKNIHNPTVTPDCYGKRNAAFTRNAVLTSLAGLLTVGGVVGYKVNSNINQKNTSIKTVAQAREMYSKADEPCEWTNPETVLGEEYFIDPITNKSYNSTIKESLRSSYAGIVEKIDSQIAESAKKFWNNPGYKSVEDVVEDANVGSLDDFESVDMEQIRNEANQKVKTHYSKFVLTPTTLDIKNWQIVKKGWFKEKTFYVDPIFGQELTEPQALAMSNVYGDTSGDNYNLYITKTINNSYVYGTLTSESDLKEQLKNKFPEINTIPQQTHIGWFNTLFGMNRYPKNADGTNISAGKVLSAGFNPNQRILDKNGDYTQTKDGPIASFAKGLGSIGKAPFALINQGTQGIYDALEPVPVLKQVSGIVNFLGTKLNDSTDFVASIAVDVIEGGDEAANGENAYEEVPQTDDVLNNRSPYRGFWGGIGKSAAGIGRGLLFWNLFDHKSSHSSNEVSPPSSDGNAGNINMGDAVDKGSGLEKIVIGDALL